MSPTRIFPAIALLALAAQAHATEGGASIYPHGAGRPPMAGAPPPPGAYGMVYGQHYHAGRLTTTTAITSTCPISASMPT